MTLVLGRFDEKWLPEQRALFRLAFPEQVALDGADFYNWKFRDSPANPPSYEYIATEDGDLLGYYAALPYRYRIAGEMVTAGMVCDVMTHPKARGRGVFTAIGHYATQDLARRHVGFVTGYPIRIEVIPGHLKVGWQIVRDLPMYIRPIRSSPMLPGVARVLAPAIDLAFDYQRRIQDRQSRVIRTEVVDIESLLARVDYDHFLANSASRGVNALEKSRAFMRWRLGAPGTHYRAVVALRDESLAAVAIARSTILRNVRTLALLDFMVSPTEAAAIGPLHKHIVKLAKEEGVDAIVAMCAPSAARRFGITRRFLRSSHTFKLIVKRLDLNVPQQVEKPAAWEPMWIDSDDL